MWYHSNADDDWSWWRVLPGALEVSSRPSRRGRPPDRAGYVRPDPGEKSIDRWLLSAYSGRRHVWWSLGRGCMESAATAVSRPATRGDSHARPGVPSAEGRHADSAPFLAYRRPSGRWPSCGPPAPLLPPRPSRSARHRCYSPAVGRFLSRARVGCLHALSLHRYAVSCPAGSADRACWASWDGLSGWAAMRSGEEKPA